MADLVAVMDQGRIAQLGTPEEIFERPLTPYVADFVGRSARFEGPVRDGAVQVSGGAIRAVGLPAAGVISVFVRPHRLRVLAEGDVAENVISGVVASADYTGDAAQLFVQSAAGRFPVNVATADGKWRGWTPGSAVRIGWRTADTIWFAK